MRLPYDCTVTYSVQCAAPDCLESLEKLYKVPAHADFPVPTWYGEDDHWAIVNGQPYCPDHVLVVKQGKVHVAKVTPADINASIEELTLPL